jgi:hypothetical protein
MYAKMPLGLMNVVATFQRAMDIDFVGEKDKFVLIYLDDITVYSNSHDPNGSPHVKELSAMLISRWRQKCLNDAFLGYISHAFNYAFVGKILHAFFILV